MLSIVLGRDAANGPDGVMLILVAGALNCLYSDEARGLECNVWSMFFVLSYELNKRPIPVNM